jgi:Arylsulfotransferase (ASST)
MFADLMNARPLVPIPRLAALLVVALAIALPARAHAATPLDVLPFPGTPDASPQTQIDFPTVPASQLRQVIVTGSRSGEHPGSIKRGAGDGSAFFPSRAFADGEHVTVHAIASGGRKIAWAFTVAIPARASEGSASNGAAPAIVHQSDNPAAFTRSFHSTSLRPPVVVTNGKDTDQSSGDIFTDAQRSIQAGPLILNPQGRPVWFDSLTGDNAGTDLQLQDYRGQSDLTFWEGQIADGWGRGEDVIMNHSYQTIATVKGADGYQPDLHEFYINSKGDAFVTAYAPVQADLSSVGGPSNGTLLDSIILEINVATGQLLWEWHAYGHVHLAESYAGKPGSNPYDFFHINSIQELPSGNLIVSARHTFAVYDIVPSTGKIKYVIGGKHSSFKMGPGTNFEWQHDAQLIGWTLTLFNDAYGYRKSESQSRAMVIWLHPKSMTATLTHQYTHNPPVLSQSEGNLQLLPHNNVFVGFGANPYMTEFSTAGKQEFSARFVSPVEFYRAYRFPWSATPPLSNLGVAASPTSNGTTVYASWNGATQIANWRVLAGPSSNKLSVVGEKPFNGFETGISTSSTQAYFAAQALDSSGQVLGTSKVIPR